MRIMWSERIHVKQRCENNHSILKDVQCMHWETGGRALFLPEREMCLKDSDIVERDSWNSPVASKWEISFPPQTAVVRQFFYDTFQPPTPRPLSPPNTTSGLKGSCCTLCLFLYCTCKRDSVSVICKTKKGDRQRARSLKSVTHILKKKKKKKTTDFSARHVPVISLCCNPYSHVR